MKIGLTIDTANLINVKVLNKQGRSEGKDQYRFVEGMPYFHITNILPINLLLAVRDVTEEHLANLKNPVSL